MTYAQALKALFNEYGNVPYPYFEKESYNNFINEKIAEPIRNYKILELLKMVCLFITY